MKKIFVFDLDGTLAHTEVYWLPILDRTLAEIEKRYGIVRSIGKLEEALPLLGKPDTEVFGGLFPGQPLTDYRDMIRLANEIWMEMVEAHPYILYPGVLNALNRLKGAGYDLFLASNCDELYMKGLLDTGLRSLVTDTVCVGSYPGLEKWEFTRIMLSHIGPYAGYFVGDSASDMKAGRENGLTTIFADYGYGAGPEAGLIDLRIGGIEEVLQLI